MTTPGQVVNKYQTSPFDLFMDLRGKEFTIIEPISKGKDLREIEENNKWGKKGKFYFIKVECGMFQKDLKLTEREMTELFLIIPPAVIEFIGTVIEVDQHNSKVLKYKGSVMQDMAGNPLAKGNTYNSMQNEPISQPQQPQDQKETYLKFLVQAVKSNKACNIKTDDDILLKIAESITPGKGKELIYAAKFERGIICQKDGANYEVVE